MKKIAGGSAGFTIAELLVSMLIVSIMMGAIFASFTTLTSSFKVQTKTAESQIEDVLSLELLRYDLESAGYGLPEGTGGGACSTIAAYSEYPTGFTPTGNTNYTPNQYTPDPATDFNDSTSSCEPRPIVLDHNTNPTPSNSNGSDVLVIKSITADRTAVTKKWTMLDNAGHFIVWNDLKWDLCGNANGNAGCAAGLNERAIAVSSTRQLISGGFQFSTLPAAPAPGQSYIIYGVNSTTNLRMPFNRVDYYLQRPCSSQLGTCTGTPPQHPYPLQCHPSGYTLYRAVLSHSNGQRVEQPIMDCVIDFQVALGVDTGCTDTLGNGCTGTLTWCRFTNLTSNPGSATPCNSASDAGCTADPCRTAICQNNTSYCLNNAQNIRTSLKQVKVFVLTHEGKIDPNFTYANNSIAIGDSDITLKTYDLTTLANYARYRWKLQKINVKLNSLGGNYE
ncbi:MAG: prepilin-type N-terminal cleavage/methylation domain-containing protein [Nitrospirae bacterium]|nr:prepilin-type N-terminal cleavage/methylation domain-containing protein [Nitrospirota bacterium]